MPLFNPVAKKPFLGRKIIGQAFAPVYAYDWGIWDCSHSACAVQDHAHHELPVS